MDKTVLATELAPAAIGPYSQGVRAGGFVFASGQLPADPGTGELETDICAAARRALDNVRAVLRAGGADLADAVKVTVYLTDMADFSAVNEVYAAYFDRVPPARCCVAVAELPRGAKIEVDAIAVCR